jgi:HK97 gp10 family phage protein
MPAINDTIVLGLEDVRAKLKELPKRLGINVVRRGLLAASGVIRDRARQNAPVRTGALKRSIISRTNNARRNKDEYRAEVTISKAAYRMNDQGKLYRRKSTTKNGKVYERGDIYPRNYAHLVEFGTKPHILTPKNRKNSNYRGPKHHPGAKPNPFMTRARDEGFEPAIKKFSEVMRRETEKEVAKMAKEKMR